MQARSQLPPLKEHNIKDAVALQPEDGNAPSPVIAHGDGRIWPVMVPYRKLEGSHANGDVFYGGYRPPHADDHLLSQQPETSLETTGKATSRIRARSDQAKSTLAMSVLVGPSSPSSPSSPSKT